MSNLSNMLISMLVAVTIGCSEDSEMPLLEPNPSIKEMLCKRWRLLQTVSGSDTSTHLDTVNYSIDSIPNGWFTYNKDGTFFGYTQVPVGHSSFPLHIEKGHWSFNQDSTILTTQVYESNGQPDTSIAYNYRIIELTPSILRSNFMNPRVYGYSVLIPYDATSGKRGYK